MIKEAHRILMQGVRGQGKAQGEYRKIPNWIGPPGTPIEKATYVPFSAGKLPSAMGRWERFIHDDAADKLVQQAKGRQPAVLAFRKLLNNAEGDEVF